MLPLNNIAAAILDLMRTLMQEEAGAADVAARACWNAADGSGSGKGGAGEGGGAAQGNGVQPAAWGTVPAR